MGREEPTVPGEHEVTIVPNDLGPLVRLANGQEFPSHAVVTVFRSPPPGYQIALEVIDGKPVVTKLVIGLPVRDAPTSSHMLPLPLTTLRALELERLVEKVVGGIAEHVVVRQTLAEPGGVDR